MSRNDGNFLDRIANWFDEFVAETVRADFVAEALLTRKQLYDKETPRFHKEQLEILRQQRAELVELRLKEFRKSAHQLLVSAAKSHDTQLNELKSKAAFLILSTPQAQEALETASLDRLEEEGWATERQHPRGSDFCFFPEKEGPKTSSTTAHTPLPHF